MSRASVGYVNITDSEAPGAGGDKYPPKSAPNRELQSETSFVDSSGPIFSKYLEMAEEEDQKRAENWKADAEGILVFTGLFSAAVASLISVSIQDILQNPQDTSNFYLANIYQATVDPTRFNISGSLPASPPPFSPPSYAVWVNSLWFLSLVISITCALLATFLQQWARRYLKVTRPRYTLHKQARIRSFFAEGVEKSLLPLAVEALPTLLHISLFLFFIGLVVFLWNANLTIFKVVLSWISGCTAVYGCITLIPIFRLDSPYYTPLTPLASFVVVGILYVFHFLFACVDFFFFFCCCSCCFRPLRLFSFMDNWLDGVLDMTLETPEEAALMAPSEIDARAFMWTFDRLDEDDELEHFFSGLPGFHNSKVLSQPLRNLNNDQKLKLSTAMIGLLDRTFSSDFLTTQVKRYRADMCAKAIELVDTPKAFPEILRRLASEDGYGPLKSTETVHFVRRWDIHKHEDETLVQAMLSVVVARVQRHDDSWFILASKALGITEAVLREHAAHGDSLSLSLLIHITRQHSIHLQNPSWPSPAISIVLGVALTLNAQNTSPKLQHEFCALWNQIVRKAQNDNDGTIAILILKPIRKIYITLHQGTDSAPKKFSASTPDEDYILMQESAYPVCSVAGHIHDDTASATFPLTIHHDNTVLPPTSIASPGVPSLSVTNLLRVDQSLTTLPSPDNYTFGSLHTAHQIADEDIHISATSQGLVTDGVIKDGTDISTTTVAFSTTELSSSIPPIAVSARHIAHRRTSFNVLNVPSLPFPTSVLETMHPTGSHSSMIVHPPSGPPQLTSAPDHGATLEGGSDTMATFRNKEDTQNSLPALRRDMIAAPCVPAQSPAPPSVNSTTIVGPSQRSLDAERMREDPPYPSHGKYDIV